MRGRLLACLVVPLFLYACGAVPPAKEPPSVSIAPEPLPPLAPLDLFEEEQKEQEEQEREPVYHFPEVGPAKPARTSAPAVEKKEPEPVLPADTSKPEPPPPQDILELQKKRVAANPTSDEEKIRLALLHAAAGEFEEADRVLSGVRERESSLLPVLEFFLKRRLGAHQEASKILDRFNEEERKASGFQIGRAELCTRVKRYRDYVRAESDRVPAGGPALIYVEPRNFALRRDGERYIVHLNYDWKLFDARSEERAVPAWEAAPLSDREDRISFLGPVGEFYQSFALPLPGDLEPGAYQVMVRVTDALTGQSDQVLLPIRVVGAEGK